MTRTVEAIFDGEVFRPEQEVDLEPNTRVRITVEAATEEKLKTVSFLDTAASLNLEGPPDLSVRYEEYLYGREINLVDNSPTQVSETTEKND